MCVPVSLAVLMQCLYHQNNPNASTVVVSVITSHRRQLMLPFVCKLPVASDKCLLMLVFVAELSDLMNASRFAKLLWEKSENKHHDCPHTHMSLAN